MLGLLYTGFEIHGTIRWLGYERAVWLHGKLAATLVALVLVAIFWELATGSWRRLIPTRHKLRAMVRYYFVGIFRNEPQPMRKTELSRLNPLQRIMYLALKVVVFPVQIGSGLLYLFYNELPTWGWSLRLGPIAFIHTAATFTLLVFVILHLYFTTTDLTPLANIKTMWRGWEEADSWAAATGLATATARVPDAKLGIAGRAPTPRTPSLRVGRPGPSRAARQLRLP